VFFSGNVFSNSVSGDSVANTAENFIENTLLAGQADVTITSVDETNGLYKLGVKISSDAGSQDVVSYMTKDGKILFPTGIILEEQKPVVQTPTQEKAQPVPEITKSDKPVVELFVMSHCPYGTQAEKGIIPAVETLGDAIDFKIRFVYYAMHGEKEVREEIRQYCIQKEQNNLYFDYLKCFLKDGNSESCLDEAGIDTEQLNTCIETATKEFNVEEHLADKTQRFPAFDTDKTENEKYGISGSPTLVINGEKVNSARNSAAYLATICAAFNNPPEECNTELSTSTPSPGFGYSTTGTDTTAQC